MESLKYLPKYTIADYNLWEGDWELIDGRAVSMSPSPIFRHQDFGVIILGKIHNALNDAEVNCGNCNVVYELDWIINENTVICPDIAIVCDFAGNFITSPPVLVIEILSPSTALRDRHVKYEIYQTNGVKYYIIADTAAKTFQAYILIDGLYQPHDLATFAIHGDCNISIDIAKALAELKD